MAETRITFDQAGNMSIEATGYVGNVCAETTDLLMKGLGATKKAEQRKPEYNMVNRAGTKAGIVGKR